MNDWRWRNEKTIWWQTNELRTLQVFLIQWRNTWFLSIIATTTYLPRNNCQPTTRTNLLKIIQTRQQTTSKSTNNMIILGPIFLQNHSFKMRLQTVQQSKTILNQWSKSKLSCDNKSYSLQTKNFYSVPLHQTVNKRVCEWNVLKT